MRGDNAFLQHGERAVSGSPPRARGQRPEADHRAEIIRFTPACAGTTMTKHARNQRPLVHPRVRGDNVIGGLADVMIDGSPPRARGQRCNNPHGATQTRFTPACAGTTSGNQDETLLAEVHPRVRGDNGRGVLEIRRDFRFTPACAGTTAVGGKARRGCAVHPRVRGDNATASSLFLGGTGSPPRARGQPAVWGKTPALTRFTSACAGTTTPRQNSRIRPSVHPRVRGDNSSRCSRCV